MIAENHHTPVSAEPPQRLPEATAWVDGDLLAAGSLRDVAAAAKESIDAGDTRHVLVLDGADSRQLEIDYRGTLADVLARIPESAAAADAEGEPTAADPEPAEATPGPRSPGRPKLGVVGREVTLLPRHWEWLNAQPGGASVALRKLVEAARKQNADAERVRAAQDVTYRFLSLVAGNEAGYEEAIRALYASDAAKFVALSEAWRPAVRDYARLYAGPAFEASQA